MTETSTTETERRPPRRRSRRGRTRPRRGGPTRPVPLHKRTLSHFQPGDRQRGADYLHDDRVQLEIDGARARARVMGNEKQSYAVGLDWSRVPAERKLHAFCDCPRFAKGTPCKHVWASLLALAEAGPEHQPPGKGRLGLRKDDATRWRDLGVKPKPKPKRDDRARGRARGRPAAGPRTIWRSQLATLQQKAARLGGGRPARRGERDIRFLINTTASVEGGGLVLDVFGRPPNGANASGLVHTSVEPEELEQVLGRDQGGASSLLVVAGLPKTYPARNKSRGRRGPSRPPRPSIQRFRLPPRLYETVLPRLGDEHALGWWDGRSRRNLHRLSWDDGAPWRLTLRLDETAGGGARLRGALERNGESVALDAPVAIVPGDPERGGLVLFEDTVGRLSAPRGGDPQWFDLLRDTGEVAIPKEDLEEAVTSLLEIPGLPPLETPEGLRLSEEESPPQPRLVLTQDPAAIVPDPPLVAELSFRYGAVTVSAGDPRSFIIDRGDGTFVRRDPEAEHAALVRVLEAGVRPVAAGQEHGHELELPPAELPTVAEPLLADGWEVEVRGAALRSPSPPALKVESGIDWFELSGSTDFAGDRVELQKILEAISRGDRFVELVDGSRGLLPSSWIETYDSLAKLSHGEGDDGGLRFLTSQAPLVDALLATMPPADVDQAFAELRAKLGSFERIKPKKEPRGFRGTLRGYQRQGLGWLDFLREFGLGGVLADDMGLGKTVQVLALLRANRTPSKTTGLPSLVVAPRSLVYNWIEEAARFTPTLKTVEYLGPDREALREKLGKYDLVVTTYGTLRRDVAFLATVEFDTVILDEAQAIKNRDSQSAKASRLLRGRNRLALTGTPIENHLGELGSIFEFLNPGLLGRMPKLDALASGRTASQSELALIAEGIRPFILRRTKAEVLADLPPKTEQVLYCTLRPEQREIYDKVRAGYQASLLGEVEAGSVKGSAIQVLEALLRLRQVACHPGLVNDEWEDAGSAKLEALFEQIAEVLDEGHKLIIFSQFTSLLAYVREHLDEIGTDYAYLDGQTRNRGEVVERFQNDPDCNIFLISLKAGGVGLNLTAAGYVFLLDPWWNPAVEAQAIDRAHRIGQTQPVFSYRLIARDTVEEKILELQRSKRQLADAVLDGEGLSVGQLTADDLRMLLS